MSDSAKRQLTMHDFVLIVVMHNMATYRVEVTATDWQAACREVIHTQMKKGMPVRSIREED